MIEPPENSPEPPPRIYANWITPRPGAYDLALDFGYERPVGEEPDPEWLVTVVLAWEEAFELKKMLERAIAHYEEHAGSIRNWEEPLPPFDDNGAPEDDEDD